MSDTIDLKALQRVLDQSAPEDSSVALVDVLPPPYFENGHIPGASNHCVYEVGFSEGVQQAFSNRKAALVLYDTGGGNQAVWDARRKLLAAGYTNLLVYEGGLTEWVNAGLPLEGSGVPLPEDAATAHLVRGSHSLPLDTGESTVVWRGRNLSSTHWGLVPVAHGELHVVDGELRGGVVTLDVAGLSNENLGEDLAPVLEAHLKSDDFFETATYPEARFELTRATSIADSTQGGWSHTLHGRATIKGQMHEMELPAQVAVRNDGRLTVQGVTLLNRTDFGVRYGSGRLYKRLGMHLVDDHVSLEIRLVAQALD